MEAGCILFFLFSTVLFEEALFYCQFERELPFLEVVWEAVNGTVLFLFKTMLAVGWHLKSKPHLESWSSR